MAEIHSGLADRTTRLTPSEDTSKLDAMLTDYAPVYAASLVKMNEAFRTRLLEEYEKEPRWDRIQKVILDNNALGDNTAKLPYQLI